MTDWPMTLVLFVIVIFCWWAVGRIVRWVAREGRKVSDNFVPRYDDAPLPNNPKEDWVPKKKPEYAASSCYSTDYPSRPSSSRLVVATCPSCGDLDQIELGDERPQHCAYCGLHLHKRMVLSTNGRQLLYEGLCPSCGVVRCIDDYSEGLVPEHTHCLQCGLHLVSSRNIGLVAVPDWLRSESRYKLANCGPMILATWGPSTRWDGSEGPSVDDRQPSEHDIPMLDYDGANFYTQQDYDDSLEDPW